MIHLVILKSKLLLTVICHCTELLLVDAFYTYSGRKIKEVQVSIPFSFLNELWTPVYFVLFFAGFQEVTVDKAFFLFRGT